MSMNIKHSIKGRNVKVKTNNSMQTNEFWAGVAMALFVAFIAVSLYGLLTNAYILKMLG